MRKIKEKITILAIGDKADYDSFKKLNREKHFILRQGFDYASMTYEKLLDESMPLINTEKIIIFLFFPFRYWNKHIERRGYKGIYGNQNFYKKFNRFWGKVTDALKSNFPDKKLIFINSPHLSSLCRDKLRVVRKLARLNIPQPKLYRFSHAKDVEKLLAKGHSFFLKPRFGSMGKGITVLRWSSWQTNFSFKNNRIMNKRSDHGWTFRDVTGNRKLLNKLLKGEMLMEEEVNSLIFKRMKIDTRMYVFLNRVIYVYPRRNKTERLTTNISQGAKGDPEILTEVPGHLIEKAKRLAVKVSKILRLNFAGIDVMIDRNLKDVYILDVNAFPGFPKRRTFNLAQGMIEGLAKKEKKNGLYFKKGRSIF